MWLALDLVAILVFHSAQPISWRSTIASSAHKCILEYSLWKVPKLNVKPRIPESPSPWVRCGLPIDSYMQSKQSRVVLPNRWLKTNSKNQKISGIDEVKIHWMRLVVDWAVSRFQRHVKSTHTALCLSIAATDQRTYLADYWSRSVAPSFGRQSSTATMDPLLYSAVAGSLSTSCFPIGIPNDTSFTCGGHIGEDYIVVTPEALYHRFTQDSERIGRRRSAFIVSVIFVLWA